MKAIATGLVLSFLLFNLPAGQAHEGHDHGAPLPPVSATIAPRFETSTEAFELVVCCARENSRCISIAFSAMRR